MNEEEQIKLEKESVSFGEKMYTLYKNKGYDYVIRGIIDQLKGTSEIKNKLLAYIILDLQKNGVVIKEQLNTDLLKVYLDNIISNHEQKKEDSVSENTSLFNITVAKEIINSPVTEQKEVNDKPSIALKKEEFSDPQNQTKKHNILIQASIETYAKYKNHKDDQDFGTKQLRKAILDKDNDFLYFTNAGEKKLRDALRRNIKVAEVPSLVKEILIKNGIKADNSNEQMCCELYLSLIDRYYQQIKNPTNKESVVKPTVRH